MLAEKFEPKPPHFLSQNHRIAKVGGDLWRSSSPTPMPRHDHLEQVTQNMLRWVWSVSTEGDFMTSLDSLFHCSAALTVKKFLILLSWNFLCFVLWPLLLILLLGTTEESGATRLTPAFEIFICINETFSVFSRLKTPPFLNFYPEIIRFNNYINSFLLLF